MSVTVTFSRGQSLSVYFEFLDVSAVYMYLVYQVLFRTSFRLKFAHDIVDAAPLML